MSKRKREGDNDEDEIITIVMDGFEITVPRTSIRQIDVTNIGAVPHHFCDMVEDGILFMRNIDQTEIVDVLKGVPNLKRLRIVLGPENARHLGTIMSHFRRYSYSLPQPIIFTWDCPRIGYKYRFGDIRLSPITLDGFDHIRAARSLTEGLITQDDGTNEYDAAILTMKMVMLTVLRNL